MKRLFVIIGCLWGVVGFDQWAGAQPPDEATAKIIHEKKIIREKLTQLNAAVETLKSGREDLRPVADVEIFAKAADWILRHDEFFKPEYATWTVEALEVGLKRAEELAGNQSPWRGRAGSTVLAYYSDVDASVQPFVVILPKDYDAKSLKRWPLHVELHGRGDTMNEVSFIHGHEGRDPKVDAEFIQLEPFGRTNNAYRWAGEADVFEAMAATKRLFRVDDHRMTLRGFSMGGAGAWHLGLHYPSLWSSVGAGAGFCDTIHHLGLKEPLSPLHQKLTRIYDAQDYAMNAFDVPTIGYGGELDKQIFASKTMHEKGEELGVPIKRLIGPKSGIRTASGNSWRSMRNTLTAADRDIRLRRRSSSSRTR
jgi:Putative esterase